MATNEDIFDFFGESNIKERLWEQMKQKAAGLAPQRVEVSFDSLGDGSSRAAQPIPAAPMQAKNTDVTKSSPGKG